MRLWHEALLPRLDNKRLLAQHRECCALRGNGWGRKHSVVDYVFTHPHWHLTVYHQRVMDQMKSRNYKPDEQWYNPFYRGKHCPDYFLPGDNWPDFEDYLMKQCSDDKIYNEHDDAYMKECLENLKRKGVTV